MKTLTFNDLVELRADEWNSLVASEYEISVEELKESLLSRNIRLLDNRLVECITKDKIESLSDKQRLLDLENVDKLNSGDTSVLYEPTAIDKFTVHISDTIDIVDSIAITGKIIIGADFSGSNLSDSYFCGCTFYRCNLSGCDFGNSVITSTDFINCNMESIDLTGSTISKSHFYENNMKKATLDYIALVECMVVACDLTNSTIIQSRILFCGFNDCEIENSDWKDSDIIQCSFTSCSIRYSDFKRVTLVDSILIRSDLRGCDLNSTSVTCITVSNIRFDAKYSHFFEMNHVIYSPSVVEWEIDPYLVDIKNDEDNDIDVDEPGNFNIDEFEDTKFDPNSDDFGDIDGSDIDLGDSDDRDW